MTTDIPIAGVVLAGGQSRRMGGDKALIRVEGQSLIERVVDRARPQVCALLLNANGDPTRFAGFDLPIAADGVEGHAGPLAGILTGLEWLRDTHPEISWMASFATDAPLLPTDLVARLLAAVIAEHAEIGCARSGGITHPVFGLWPVSLAPALRSALVDEDLRKTDGWTARYRVAHVDWPGGRDDPFFNVNTPEDAIRLRLILQGVLPDHPPNVASLPVAVMVERRDSSSPWAKEYWRPVEVIAAPPTTDTWRLLQRGDGWDRYLSSGHAVELHRSDLASYRYNLGGATPRLYVALRRQPDGAAPVRVALVTAAPDEAQTLLENNEDIVEAVPLPDDIAAWIVGFTAQHPPDPPMRKRKRDNYDPDKAGFGRGGGGV